MSRTKRTRLKSPVSDCAPAMCSRGPMLPTARVAERALAGPLTLTCDGVEITQSIQNMPGHTVPIVAQKRTVVRVYLSAASASAITVRGVLWARQTSPRRRWRVVPSVGTATIDPSENGKLRPKRESEAKSLNFVLPAAICAAGPIEVRLVSVVRVAPSGILIPPANAHRTVSFVASAPLRVRIVGIRFQAGAPPAVIEPSSLDFTLIRSWLGRAYPVASVEWSQVTLAAPQAWPFDAARINAFLRGIRANRQRPARCATLTQVHRLPDTHVTWVRRSFSVRYMSWADSVNSIGQPLPTSNRS